MKDILEHWLLELVVELRHPVALLTAPDLDQALNGRGHGRSAPELARALMRLWERDAIVFLDRRSAAVQPSTDDVHRWLAAESREVSFGLTAMGGAAWENATSHDWSRFVSHGYGIDPDEGHVGATTRDRAERFLRTSPFTEVVAGSEVWASARPWQATYWKQLPEGHEVTFLCRDRPDGAVASQDTRQWCAEMYDWFSRVEI